MGRKKHHAIYAVYKGEQLICTGTVIECAKQMSVTEKTVYWLNSKAYKDRVKNRKYLRDCPTIAYRIDKEDEE